MRLLLASSSTGGHIYPALAIAAEVRAREPEAEILFVGASWEISKDIVGRYGYKQAYIDVMGFDRKKPWKNFATLASLMRASRQIKKIFGEFRPDFVVGTGGHVAGPVIRAAGKRGIPTIIQEQNVLPGLANRMAEPYADKVFLAFPEAAEHFKDRSKLALSGNPVRREFFETDKNAARAELCIDEKALTVLIFGGSQGALKINEAAIRAIEKFKDRKDIVFILVTGPGHFDEAMSSLEALGSSYPALSFSRAKEGSDQIAESADGSVRVLGYAGAIAKYYAAADLIVARSGALTVSEIAASGRASILIPSPDVVDNHQYFNAKALADSGAAVLLDHDGIEGYGLADEIERLADEEGRLAEMGELARRNSKPDAAKVIVDELFR